MKNLACNSIMDMVYENWIELFWQPCQTFPPQKYSSTQIISFRSVLILRSIFLFPFFLYLLINAILPREAFDPRLISVDMSDRVTHWLLVIKDQMVTLLGCPWIFHHIQWMTNVSIEWRDFLIIQMYFLVYGKWTN